MPDRSFFVATVVFSWVWLFRGGCGIELGDVGSGAGKRGDGVVGVCLWGFWGGGGRWDVGYT